MFLRRTRAPGAASALLVAVATVTLSGCTAPAPSPAAVADAEPVAAVIDNCGTEITLGAAPQRILTIKSSALELALALGAGDRVVGSAFSDGPVPEALAADAQDVPVVSEKVPSQEAALALEPDLVFAG